MANLAGSQTPPTKLQRRRVADEVRGAEDCSQRGDIISAGHVRAGLGTAALRCGRRPRAKPDRPPVAGDLDVGGVRLAFRWVPSSAPAAPSPTLVLLLEGRGCVRL